MSLPVHWDSVVEDRPLLDVLAEGARGVPADERFAFVKGGRAQDDGLVGWGVAARIAVGSGPDRFARARAGLAALTSTTVGTGRAVEAGDGTAAPRGPATRGPVAHGPVAFASFTFDEDDDASIMVVPQVVMLRRDGRTWRITAGATPPDALPEPGPHPTVEPGESDRPRYAGSTVRDDRWLEAVAGALRAIEADEYAKVVLARDLHLWSKRPFDVPRLLEDLAARFPSCMTFLVDHLVGASPELLVRRDGDAVASRVLAGTAPRGSTAEEDAALGAALLASDKDRREHDLALRSAVASLETVCTTLDVPDGPSLVQLDNVQHLGSDLTGTLRSGTTASAEAGAEAGAEARAEAGAAEDTHVLSLLARLHPTAAVGGEPRAAAVTAIRALEGMSRGRYAAPVGWCTPDGDGEFAIALRCAEVHGARARLFAGAGIVAGSLPEAELTETWLKLRAMTGVLDR